MNVYKKSNKAIIDLDRQFIDKLSPEFHKFLAKQNEHNAHQIRCRTIIYMNTFLMCGDREVYTKDLLVALNYLFRNSKSFVKYT